jgi:hypothetical protein
MDIALRAWSRPVGTVIYERIIILNNRVGGMDHALNAVSFHTRILKLFSRDSCDFS